MSVIKAIASFDAVGIIDASGVGENWGNLKFIPAASLKPSGQSRLSGVPNTEQILNISSISEFPGNSGLEKFKINNILQLKASTLIHFRIIH